MLQEGCKPVQASCLVLTGLRLFYLLLFLAFFFVFSFKYFLKRSCCFLVLYTSAIVNVYVFIILFYFLNVASLWLTASRPALATWSMDPEAWGLKLGAIDHDPGTVLRPSIAHDLELSSDGCQLAWWCVTNFYFELFHIFFLYFVGALLQVNIGPHHCHAKSLPGISPFFCQTCRA